MYYATNSREKAFGWAFISAISEPIGALIGWAIIRQFEENKYIYGIIFAVVAGMMVYICIFELIPTAYRYQNNDLNDNKKYHISFFVFLGMFIMALSLIMFKI